MDVSQLQAKVKVVTQRALQAIQLSADLQQRGTVRRCLDDLTNLLPTITQAATDCASGTYPSVILFKCILFSVCVCDCVSVSVSCRLCHLSFTFHSLLLINLLPAVTITTKG